VPQRLGSIANAGMNFGADTATQYLTCRSASDGQRSEAVARSRFAA
jgi:hypothetical protein